MKWIGVVPALLALGLAACSDSTPGRHAPGPGAPRVSDPEQVARGGEVFRTHCSACHGHRAQGAFNWQKLGADGKFPPPPLDGSAHAWHHSMAWLQDTIRNGTVSRGGGMPGWSRVLSDAEIDAVIAYFQSLWPEEIYRAWQDIDRRAREAAR